MQHIAIMKKSWGLIPKILSGEKSVESRWYKTKHTPWDNIKPGEVVYFKDSGSPVTIKAEVEKVVQFSDLIPEKINELLSLFDEAIGLERDKIPDFFERVKDKKYCILIFLKNAQKVEPFDIDKTGFGNMAAWIRVGKVEQVKIRK